MPSLYVSPYTKLGNNKIGIDTLIFNMSSALDCKSHKLGLCKYNNKVKKVEGKHRCYAAKMEWNERVLKYRRNQEELWDTSSVDDIVNLFNKSILSAKLLGSTVKYIRLNESGDFKTVEDIEKVNEIAKQLPHIVIYLYTQRRDLLNNLHKEDLQSNLIIQSSNKKVNNFNTFVALPEPAYKKALENKHTVACKKNCAICNLCKVYHKKVIIIEEH